jgi:hypothetical protein
MYSLRQAELTILVRGLASTLTYIKSEAKYQGEQQIFMDSPFAARGWGEFGLADI